MPASSSPGGAAAAPAAAVVDTAAAAASSSSPSTAVGSAGAATAIPTAELPHPAAWLMLPREVQEELTSEKARLAAVQAAAETLQAEDLRRHEEQDAAHEQRQLDLALESDSLGATQS